MPVLPTADPVAHGIVVGLTPASATVGQGTSASYTLQLTNAGSATDHFSLSVSGLPAGFSTSFSNSNLDVPPGATNFREVTLTIMAPTGSAAKSYPFHVLAASTTDPSNSGSVAGMLVVVARGVTVAIAPSSGAPGTTFQMTVANKGTASDTFNLSLAGPAAVVSSLATTQVTLAAGALRVVNITTTAVNFADPGGLPLGAVATSQANAAVTSSATTALIIAPDQGFNAAFRPASQALQQPGAANFVLNVNNIGNVEDAYSAAIVGSTGGVTGRLMGLDGQPTDSIPQFRLPGLSTGALELVTNASGLGTGTVTVKIASLTNPNQSVLVQAQVQVGNPNNVGGVGILLLDSCGKGR